jgi:hypothetical protein
MTVMLVIILVGMLGLALFVIVKIVTPTELDRKIEAACQNVHRLRAQADELDQQFLTILRGVQHGRHN